MHVFLHLFQNVYQFHLVCCCGSDCTAVRSAGEGQSCCQLTLCYWSRTRCSTVAQRHWSHSCWDPCPVGRTCWAPLLHTVTNTLKPLAWLVFPFVVSGVEKQANWLTDWNSSSSSDMPSNMKPPARKQSDLFVHVFWKQDQTRLVARHLSKTQLWRRDII